MAWFGVSVEYVFVSASNKAGRIFIRARIDPRDLVF
jgi:hypothetical protein